MLKKLWSAIAGKPNQPAKEEKEIGVIGRTYADGLPIVWRFENRRPMDEKRKQLPWLTVISWEYDGSTNNGMPPKEINERMITLEDALEDTVQAEGFCEHAVSKTGNGLKEFIFYIQDRDAFTEKLNEALEGHPRYPIAITFYDDPEWKELNDTLDLFEKEGENNKECI